MMRLAAALMALCGPAMAHDWYDPECCSGEDCVAVVPSAVRSTPSGWQIDLAPGVHPFSLFPKTFTLPYDNRKVRRSMDQDFHVCLGQSQNLYCLYVPDFGS